MGNLLHIGVYGSDLGQIFDTFTEYFSGFPQFIASLLQNSSLLLSYSPGRDASTRTLDWHFALKTVASCNTRPSLRWEGNT